MSALGLLRLTDSGHGQRIVNLVVVNQPIVNLTADRCVYLRLYTFDITHTATKRAHRWRCLLNLASNAGGYITLADLAGLGFTRNELAHLVQIGQLDSASRGIYRVPSFPTDWRSKLHYQCVGTSSVVSHLSAAMVLGLADPVDITPGYAEFSVERQARKRLDAVRLYQIGDFVSLPAVDRRGFRVTRIDRTLVDIAATHDVGLFRTCFNSALRQRLVTLQAFARAVAIDSRTRGRRKLLTALAAIDGELVTPSDWSQWAVERLTAAGLPKPQLEAKLHDRHGQAIGRVDLYWPEYGLVVELDGRRFHLDANSFESDRARDALLAGVGIAVLRFTWGQYIDGDYFERIVIDAVQQRFPNRSLEIDEQLPRLSETDTQLP